MDDAVSAALNEVENYEQTVKALLAFAAFVVHSGTAKRSGAEFGFGRRMETSRSNPISPSSLVTPDLVAQKSLTYGIVAEAKKSLPADKTHWSKCVTQLRKYDDPLLGWWTEDETISKSNTVILVHHSRSRPFTHLIEDIARADAKQVGPTSCVVEFVSSEESTRYYSFRLEYGQIIDLELRDRLASGVDVPLEKVLSSFPSVQYYDSEPPLPLLLTRLWLDVFPAMAAESKYDERLKANVVLASVGEVACELQLAYGSGTLATDRRSVRFPKHRWVEKAFQRLVDYGLAVRAKEDADLYEIQYRPFRRDVLTRFVKLGLDWEASNGRARPQKPIQQPLFPELQ